MTLYVPAVSDTVNLAVPVGSRVMDPRLVAPEKNSTLPVGTGPLVATTVATRIVWGGTEVVVVGTRTVTVGIAPTVWFREAEMLVLLPVSPRYVATIVCCPMAREEIVSVAVPVLSSVMSPMSLLSEVNFTVPVGVPNCPATTAVKVTGLPTSEGF